MDFETATERVKTLPSCSDEDKLHLYAYYKQATVGDINIPKPGPFDIIAKAKWDAWSTQKGVPTDKAKAAYVKKATELLKNAGLM
nr:acyl coenzyme A binding protein [Hymenolepis microstoma]